MQEYLTETPVATIIFIFTIATSIYAFSNAEVLGKFMLHPYSVYKGHKLYTLITSGLIHKDWAHLLFNMLSYFFFAFNLERILGHWQFGLLYILSLILSDLPSVAKHKDRFGYHSLGASGAVCAVLFSYILFNPLTTLIIFPIPIPIPAIIYGVLFLVYCVYAARQDGDGINHDAHFFGALAGIIITIILIPESVKVFLSQLSRFF